MALIYFHWPVPWDNRFSELVTDLLLNDLKIIVKISGIHTTQTESKLFDMSLTLFFSSILAAHAAPDLYLHFKCQVGGHRMLQGAAVQSGKPGSGMIQYLTQGVSPGLLITAGN